ncbi:M23 family metallopeptidase [Streptacidiphilus sp. N1-12]|uniref:M23 family metallopeptidase n=2 Tax=Streptacidiphilus alkalitolerans TaxID=3342712 RepID=A0ABV6WFW6_9ACTN
MHCAHRRHARSSRHAQPNAPLAVCRRCGTRLALAGAAATVLLAAGVPASASAGTPQPAAQAGAGAAGGAASVARAGAPAAADRGIAKRIALPKAGAKPAAKAAAKPKAAPKPVVAKPKPIAWDAPIPGAPMSEAYGVTDSGYAAGYHTGTDFAVDVGTPVDAIGAGTVVSAGWQTSYGNAVVLKLSGGDYALYAHLSAFKVSAGEHVSAGQRIALSGNTGNSTGPHLHFEVRTSNVYGADTNPLAFLRAHGVGDF